MTLRAYRDAVVAVLKAVPGVKDCASHGGTFTEPQVRQYAMRSPAVRVAFLGSPRMENSSSGELRGPYRYAAYIIANDRGSQEAADVALDLAEQIAILVDGNTFDFQGAGAANVLEVQNLFSLVADKTGISMMAVSWTAHLRVGPNRYAEDDSAFGALDNLEELHARGLGIPEPLAGGEP